MSRIRSLIKYFFVSLLFLVILICVFFIFSPYIKAFLANPTIYSYENLSPVDTLYLIAFGFFAVISILFSFILYLLSSSEARLEVGVSEKTRWLSVSREQFRRLYENAPIPYVMLDEKGNIREPNKSALRFFGVTSEEIVGVDLFSLHPDEDLDKGKQFRKNYELGLPINSVEIRMTTKKGEIKTVMLSVLDMKNPLSSDRVGLATLFDITEQKRLDQAKTEFLSLASHQLRTPLASMKWFTEMLKSGEVGELLPKQKEYIEKLYEVNKEMIELVDVLLNVSRIEIGTLAIDLKPTSVMELTESVMLELGPQIEKKRLKVNKQYGNFPESINSDPKLLRIIIQNLISNSVKYTPEDGSISISFEESAGDKKIIVSDTGYGIPKDQQDRIFGKLFRADNVRSLSTDQGTGLGLYMVKSILESMGGSISFISEENKGSVFTVII